MVANPLNKECRLYSYSTMSRVLQRFNYANTKLSCDDDVGGLHLSASVNN